MQELSPGSFRKCCRISPCFLIIYLLIVLKYNKKNTLKARIFSDNCVLAINTVVLSLADNTSYARRSNLIVGFDVFVNTQENNDFTTRGFVVDVRKFLSTSIIPLKT